MSTTKPKQAPAKAEWATSMSKSQTRMGTSKWMEMSMNEQQWGQGLASSSKHKWGPVSTKGDCPNEQLDKCEQGWMKVLSGNITTIAGSVVAAGATGTAVVWVAAAEAHLLLLPFYLFLIVFTCILYILLQFSNIITPTNISMKINCRYPKCSKIINK